MSRCMLYDVTSYFWSCCCFSVLISFCCPFLSQQGICKHYGYTGILPSKLKILKNHIIKIVRNSKLNLEPRVNFKIKITKLSCRSSQFQACMRERQKHFTCAILKRCSQNYTARVQPLHRSPVLLFKRRSLCCCR